ncbi:amidase domain-containing protein [Oscillibacter hominis]|uniref:Amidase domain-containing protein n=1 Tax=Oscillibacter hominis TaxID=2763056 RepID=A0A7G9B7Q0_9FIRM|nr:amidase domain-containing protein [Oscillibacter hominis]QNL45581.1 amidase domain-containing protein [Oscillibacter hominis]
MELVPYDRRAAVAYAHQWAFGRNPAFYNYDEIGGDCTNFASQCLYAGSSVMNFLPTYGWYYIDANQKSPSWTGVPFLFQFLTRKEASIGPVAEVASLEQMMPGDLVQLRFSGEKFQHTPVVVYADQPRTLGDIWVAAHSYDADNRPLNTYEFEEIRFLHITGVRRP